MKTSDISRKHRLKITRPDEGPVNPDVKAIQDAVKPLLDWAHNARIALRKLRYMYGHREDPFSGKDLDNLYWSWMEEIEDGHRLAKRAMMALAERDAKRR